jgi:hypothetical protein
MKLTLIMSPAKGIYKQAVAAYKKGLQQVYMSSDLVIDGQTYKLVGIYPVSVLLRMESTFEQFAVVDRAGHLVRDQEITSRCLQIYQTMIVINNNLGLIKQCIDANHREFQEALGIVEALQAVLQSQMDQTIDEAALAHWEGYRDYLRFGVESTIEVNKLGRQIWQLLEPIFQGEPITDGRFRELYHVTLEFSEWSRKRGLCLLESSEARKGTREALRSAVKNGMFTAEQKKQAEKILAYLDHSFVVEQTSIETEGTSQLGQAIRSLKNAPYDFIGDQANKKLRLKRLLRDDLPSLSG